MMKTIAVYNDNSSVEFDGVKQEPYFYSATQSNDVVIYADSKLCPGKVSQYVIPFTPDLRYIETVMED